MTPEFNSEIKTKENHDKRTPQKQGITQTKESQSQVLSHIDINEFMNK